MVRRVVWSLLAGVALLLPPRPAHAAQHDTLSSPRPLVTIIGQLAYRERMALPADATLLVTLTDPDETDPEAPTLARQKLELGGQQVPLRFRLSAVASYLKADRRYSLSAHIQDAQGQQLWSSQSAQLIDPRESLVDLGTLWLNRVDAAAAGPDNAAATAPTQAFLCGEQEVQVKTAGSGLDLTLDGQTHRLERQPTASGARFTGIGAGRQIEFWNKGDRARLTLDDTAAPECVRDEGGTGYQARGYGPFWTLSISDDRLELVRFGTETSQIARIPLPARQNLGDGVFYQSQVGGTSLRVTIKPGLCLDERSGIPFPDQVTIDRGNQQMLGCGGATAAFLQQGEWTLVSMNEKPADTLGISMRFQGDGTVAGSSGCNRFLARYKAGRNGLAIAVGGGAATLRACPRDVMQREQEFLTTLRAVRRHTADEEDGSLILSTDDGSELRLLRTATP